MEYPLFYLIHQGIFFNTISKEIGWFEHLLFLFFIRLGEVFNTKPLHHITNNILNIKLDWSQN